MTSPLDPARGPRIEPAAPARRIERAKDQERQGSGYRQHQQPEQRDEHEDGEDEGLHVDVLA